MLRPSTSAAALCIRCHRRAFSSAATTPVFSSYFFHNTQWMPQPSSIGSKPRQHNSIAAATTATVYKPTETLSPAKLLSVYGQLSKSRLTFSMVLTAMTGFALSPLPVTVPTLLATAIGTGLCSAAANTLNQLQEVPLDAQMARTRNRPLVRRAITPVHAAGFAAVTGITGPAILLSMTNPITAFLGAANIVLYAGPYTWMKRKSIANTWVGAIVGAIPPLMGWTACGGQLWPTASYPVHLFLPPFMLDPGSVVDLALIDNPLAPWAFSLLLFSWQFPHFNPLSYMVRGSYAQAGYRMLSVLDPRKNALVGLRHALLFIPICSILIPLSGLTTWAFAITSLVPNGIMIQAAWRFYKEGGEKNARTLFRHSLWYTPVILAIMMLHKQSLEWSRWLGLDKEKAEEVESV